MRRRLMTKVTLTLALPCCLARLAVWLVLVYRRARYGYAFRRIALTQGRFAIVDPADYESLSRHKWRLCKTKGKNVLYAERGIRRSDGKYSRILMHREVLSLSLGDVSKGELIRPPEGCVIDHVNGSGLDNRRANLRFATVAQNAWNANRRSGRSGYKGVWLAKDKGLWRASIVYCGRRKHLGYFRDKRDAAKAYDQAARQYHGEFAVLNFTKE